MQTEGPEVAISVRTFVDRYDELVAGHERFGAEAKKAHELLVTRGVTPAVVDEARVLLTRLTHVAEPAEPVSIEEQEAQLEEAETSMWAWYLEWSKIARVAIKQRVLLRQMGFLAIRRGDGEEEETDADTTTPPAAAPATTPATTAPAAPAATN